MYKPKCIACVIVFWIIAIVAVSLFGLFSVWAMSELAPAQQEAIAAINTPWISAQRDPAVCSKQGGHARAAKGNTRKLGNNFDCNQAIALTRLFGQI